MRLVYNVDSMPKRSQASHSFIFLNEDFNGIQIHHDDPMVVSVAIANFKVQMILVDSGSVPDILFYEIF